jgi:hypothetical protein
VYPFGSDVYPRTGHRPMATTQAFITLESASAVAMGRWPMRGNGYSFSLTALASLRLLSILFLYVYDALLLM